MQSPARPRLLRSLALLLGLGWSGWFLWDAFLRWRHESVCAFICGPFVPAELADTYRRAFDWQTPLTVAALPLALLGLALLPRVLHTLKKSWAA